MAVAENGARRVARNSNPSLLVGSARLVGSVYLQRAAERLKIVVPVTLLIVLLLLYFDTGSFAKTLIILLAVPFLGSRSNLVALPARLQHERRGLGGIDSSAGRGR